MKLSTKELKNKISAWLSTDESRQLIKRRCESAAEEEEIWRQWSDGGRWKREQKEKLGSEAEGKFTETDWANKPAGWQPGQPLPSIPYFDVDALGWFDKSLVDKFAADLKAAEKCVFRVFVPRDDSLADNFRLEVITTPEDDAVVAWTVIED